MKKFQEKDSDSILALTDRDRDDDLALALEIKPHRRSHSARRRSHSVAGHDLTKRALKQSIKHAGASTVIELDRFVHKEAKKRMRRMEKVRGCLCVMTLCVTVCAAQCVCDTVSVCQCVCV